MFDQLIQQLTKHYAEMVMNPATYEHAKHQIRSLRDDPSGLFVELPKLIESKLKELGYEKEK
jgi:hypothetical protein